MYAVEVREPGEDGRILVPAESKEDPECLKRKFREICNPQTNVTMERHKFNTRNQKAGETIQSYVSDLRIKAKSCNFGELYEELIINNDHLRKVLLSDSDLTLAKAISICQIHEVTEVHNTTLASPQHSTANVDAVQPRFMKKPKQGMEMKSHSEINTQDIVNCYNCGGGHAAKKDKCPAFGQQCHVCKQWNHFKKCCKSRQQTYSRQRQDGPFIS